MTNTTYSAGLMSQSFWFIEFKKIIKLLHEGRTEDEIKALCLEENLFGAAKEYRAKIAHIALLRINIDLNDGVKVNYEKVQTGQDGKKIAILSKI